MLKLAEDIKKNFNLKPKSINIDNLVFRLHYRITCWLLIIFMAIVCSKDYIGEKIKCTHSDPTDSRKEIENVIDTYCFFMSTFTIPRLHNLTGDSVVALPGVGPYESGDTELRHWYYQWVPYVLLLQALSFYVPHFIWRRLEGGILKKLVEGMTFVKMINKIERTDAMRNLHESMRDRITIHRWRLYWLFICECLNAINLILQFYLTDVFLGGRFANLGTLVYQHYGSNEFNPLDQVFPKMAKCTFQKYGASGSIQNHDAICVLALNIVNEKLYLVLWYWYVLLALPTFLTLLMRVAGFFLYETEYRYNITLFRSGLTHRPSSRDVVAIMQNLSYSEWFFLKSIVSNIDGNVGKDLVKYIADNLRKDVVDSVPNSPVLSSPPATIRNQEERRQYSPAYASAKKKSPPKESYTEKIGRSLEEIIDGAETPKSSPSQKPGKSRKPVDTLVDLSPQTEYDDREDLNSEEDASSEEEVEYRTRDDQYSRMATLPASDSRDRRSSQEE